MSDKISDVIKKLTGTTVVEITEKSQITQDEYFIQYGKTKETIRILTALGNSDLDRETIRKVRQIIKEEE